MNIPDPIYTWILNITKLSNNYIFMYTLYFIRKLKLSTDNCCIEYKKLSIQSMKFM